MYNRNILECAQIVVTDGNSWILEIEGYSNAHNLFQEFFKRRFRKIIFNGQNC